MQRMGIPRPLFSIQDRMARALRRHYRAMVRSMVRDIKQAAVMAGVTLDHALVCDAGEFLSEAWKNLAGENNQLINRANAAALENTLENQWQEPGTVAEDVQKEIEKAIKREQDDYLKRLFADADGKTRLRLDTFAIDKEKLFESNMDALRTMYIDNSLERIKGEEELIKRKILKRITDYALGKSDKLSLTDLTGMANEQGATLARLFARDQMQRFNKAVTLSTFRMAGVTKVKWVTSHDRRVRETHRALDGHVFGIEELPEEVDDYNCRCGLVPVEWADD